MKLSNAQIKFLRVIAESGERGNSNTFYALKDRGLFEKAPPVNGFVRYQLTDAGKQVLEAAA